MTVARSRLQYFLADLVAIVALGGLVLALVRSTEQPANFVGILFLICLVGTVWLTLRKMRGQPACEECGRRFVPPRKRPSIPLCPRCGQPQLGPGRSRKALAISFWAVLALIVIVVALVRFLTVDLAGSAHPSISWIALYGIALPLQLTLLLGLSLVLLGARFWVGSARRKPVPCEKCGSIIPPEGTTGPLICPRCRLRHLPKEQLRKEQAKGVWIILALLLIMGLFAGFMLPVSVSSHLGVSYWVALPLVIVATTVGLPVIVFVALVLLYVVRACLRDKPSAFLARLLIVGLIAAFVLPVFVGSHFGISYWIALPLVIVAVMVGLPAVFFIALVLHNVMRARRLRGESYVLASARKASGQEGEVVRSGPVTVWYSGPTNPVPLLTEQMEASRSRVESLLGREIGNQPPLRILCFRTRSAFEAFV